MARAGGAGVGDHKVGRVRRLIARCLYPGLLGLTAVTDLVPARFRFGHWQRVLALLAPAQLPPAVNAPDSGRLPGTVGAGAPVAEQRAALELAELPAGRSCLLVAGGLDNGGVEAVVAVLALRLPEHGWVVEVVCNPGGGRVADRLRAAGVAVSEVPSAQLQEFVSARSPDVVQLHRAEASLMTPVRRAGVPCVPVFHAIESYLDDSTWRSLNELVSHTGLAVAVSANVRTYFAARLVEPAEIRVVVNGAPSMMGSVRIDRAWARRWLGAALGVDLGASVVVVSLLRFSDQKNASGLVDAFLLASERRPDLRLVVAGAADSWLEYRKADCLRRGHPNGERVHLLGISDASLLLSAADAFALDSFAEGGPMAAVEAAALGLPLILSDVGFAHELAAGPGVAGTVVDRASYDVSARAVARERRRRHQSNRARFAEALAAVVPARAAAAWSVPSQFTEDAMVAGHAAALRAAVRPAGE